MARRKGISSNTIKSRGGLMTLGVQQPREQTPIRDTGVVDNTNENMKPNCVVAENPRESHNLNNNNDSRYLHKKFKKMATVLQADNDLSRSSSDNNSVKISVNGSESIVSSRCHDVPTSSDSDSVQDIRTTCITVSVPNSTTSHTVSNSSNSNKINHVTWQYNVQTNYKEYSHIVNSVGDGKSELLSQDDNIKTLDITLDPQDTCEASKDLSNNTGNGKHICPYCKLSCAKPSVLQKHIRAHTNERPYPCIPCGFAFKTKSNLYKHCRSRSHALRMQGTEDTPNAEEEWSLGSETEILNSNSLKTESTWSLERLYPQGDSMETCTENDFVSSPNHLSSQSESKSKSIYKPKFHKANLYVEDDDSQRSTISPNSEFLKQHISKIISDNEAIVDGRDSLLHRKYMKDNSNHKVSNDSTSQQVIQQPLNLSKTTELSDANYRKRCYSESFAQPDSLSNKASQHPLNPEGSIIKDLLLKARAQARGLLPVTSETYDGSETLYTCSSCQIPFRSADNLEIHTLYYCKSNSAAVNSALINGSLPNSRELLRGIKPDNIGYIRSNSVHVTLPETYNPNTLAKLASSTLRTPLRANKPENLVLHKSDTSELNTPLPSPGPLLGNTRLVDSHRSAESSVTSENNNKMNPSPLRRKEESSGSEFKCSLSIINQENTQVSEMFSPKNKVRSAETPTTLRSLEELSLSPIKQNSTSLQMFGGEVKILDNSGGTTTMRIEPLTSQQSPTMISQSRASPKAQGPESIVVRSGLHSGGTIVHNPPTPKEPLPSPHPQTPRLLVSIAPNISTPNLSVSGIPAPNMTKFQFPPIGSITAFNPLTLPPLSSPSSPGGPTTILHGGKLIPYVPGMPGPNSLSSFLPIHPKLSLNMVKSIEALNNASESKRDHISSGEISRTNITITPVESNYGSILHVPQKLNNHNTSTNDKKELHLKVNNTTHSITKFTIPTVKITPDLSSPSTSMAMKNDFTKSLLPQHKIDELLKRNSEILQKNDISREAKQSSPSNFKFQLKAGEKHTSVHGHETKHKDNFAKFSKHSMKHSSTDTNQFNFESLISKSQILIKPAESGKLEGNTNISKTAFKADETKTSERSETSYFKKAINPSTFNNSKSEGQKTKFLRPTSLPLKPGTFTPKRHHGITPNANTLPLISPETPRPAKAYGQLYLNGHAYTYLGLKCSTKVYYCTLNRPQPTYVPNQHSLSMYSNWQVCSEATPHPLGLAPGKAMVHYDSRHRPQNYSVAKIKQDHLMTHSSQWSVTMSKQQELPASSDGTDMALHSNNTSSNGDNCHTGKNVKNLSGGFESNEEYTYVRGRGRGRYVCSECGIRCKKPSMLKKHIRTHTDVRPFTCKHCAFSFKTKGNLTKHMKSKAHYKKCMELGISPMEEGGGGEDEGTMGGGGGDSDEESDSEDDANDGETESSDTDSWKSRLEHEAAHCLLSLWGGRPAPGLLSSARPTTYPYTPNTTEPSTPGALPQDSLYKEGNQSVIKKQSVSPMFKHDNAVRSSSQNQQSCYPMDLSKPSQANLSRNEETRNVQQSVWIPAEDILTPVGEPDLLASLVQSSAKLPQRTNEWHDDEPMLQAYLTEKALQDSKMKQSQYKNAQLRQIECSITGMNDVSRNTQVKELTVISFGSKSNNVSNIKNKEEVIQIITTMSTTISQYNPEIVNERSPSPSNVEKNVSSNLEASTSTENAKFVASEYLKAVCGKTNDSNEMPTGRQEKNVEANVTQEETSGSEKETEIQKISSDHVGIARKVVVEAGGVGFKLTPSNDYSTLSQFAKGHVTEDGRSMCVVCNKTFSKPSQLRLHINIHYMERPFRCSACAVSFRTRGHLQKHERSGSHHNKVSMTSTFGAATTTNPRPFKCSDCKIAFRIHGHLAKHLRSKMHVMRLECLGKLPFGTFAEIERAGVSLTDIDTTDCDNSLASLQLLAQKLHEKDPTKLEKWDPATMAPPLLPPGADSSDEDEPASPLPMEGISEGAATLCSVSTIGEE